MKIISNTKELQFLINVSVTELKQILGIESVRLINTIDIDDCILNNTELQISNNYRNGKRIKEIVQREAFKTMKDNLKIAIEMIDDAENKFSNLVKTLEQ